MSDGDKDPLTLDPALVATALTTILIAGSVYLWRPNIRLPLITLKRSPHPDSPLSNPPEPSTSSLAISGADRGDTEKSKAARSKERRRRGKDPLRDILKNGKKLRALSKLNLTPIELDTVKASAYPPAIDSPQQASSATASTVPSSRSESSSRSRTRNAGHESGATEFLQLPDGNGEALSVIREPSQKRSLDLAVSDTDDLSFERSKPSRPDLDPELKGTPPDPFNSLQEVSSSSSSSSLNKDATVATDPPQTDTTIFPSAVHSPPISVSASSPAVVIYSKHGLSTSQTSPPDFPVFSEGRLDAPISTSSHRQRGAPYPDSSGLMAPSALSIPNGSHGTQRVLAPRRTPTPSSRASSPPPSLTTQTQIASLRGALEAARQRETQMKSDLERYSKELEYMRCEAANWRRREHELQNQVQYLALQLQSFFQMTSSVSFAGSSALSNGATSSGNGNTPSSPSVSPSKEGHQVSLPPRNASPQQPPHAVTSPTQVTTPSTVFSPLSVMHPLSPSIYYPYPHIDGNHAHFSPHIPVQIYPFPLTATQPISNQASFVAAFSHHHHHGASPSPGPSVSGPSSATGSSSSVGSMSPDVGNSSTMAMADRGRRKTRGHVGDWVETREGHTFIPQEVTVDDGSEDGEGGVSDILADAILKRPGTLRLGKAWGKRTRFTVTSKSGTEKTDTLDPDVVQTEFTFPSLSNFGNVNGKKPAERSRVDGSDYITASDHPERSRPNGSISYAAETGMYDPQVELLPALNERTSALELSQPGGAELPAG